MKCLYNMIMEPTKNINIFIDIQEYVLFFNLKGTYLKRHIGMTNNSEMMHHIVTRKYRNTRN